MKGLGSSCGACKFLRRKCITECIFAPYFSYEHSAKHFAAVHKVFGASNVSKLLQHLPVNNRSDAAQTVAYEALARMRDPVYGCVADIFALQQQVANLQEEIEVLINQNANLPVGIPNHPNSQAAEIRNLDYQPYPVAQQYVLESQNNFCNFTSPQMNFEGAEPGNVVTYPWVESINW